MGMEMDGIERIEQEHIRQVMMPEIPGRDKHHNQELIKAACCYLLFTFDYVGLAKHLFPWAIKKWWKPNRDPIRNLEIAGALIAMEIDRRNGKEGIIKTTISVPDYITGQLEEDKP